MISTPLTLIPQIVIVYFLSLPTIQALAAAACFSASSLLTSSKAVCLLGTCLPFSKPGRSNSLYVHFFM